MEYISRKLIFLNAIQKPIIKRRLNKFFRKFFFFINSRRSFLFQILLFKSLEYFFGIYTGITIIFSYVKEGLDHS